MARRSILLTVLIITSLVAPIGASQTAAAQDYSFTGICDSPVYQYSMPMMCALQSSDPVRPSADEVDMHLMATSEWESYQSHHVNMENYLQDTSTIASLEARNAIATAYEQGNSSAEASLMARDAVRDYYSLQQQNHLEVFSKAMTQYSYVENVSRQESDISGEWVTLTRDSFEARYDQSSSPAVYGETRLDDLQTVNATLINGSSRNVTTGSFEVGFDHYDDGYAPAENQPTAIDPWSWSYNASDELWTTDWIAGSNVANDLKMSTSAKIIVPNVGNASEGGLESARVWDTREFWDVWTGLQDQSDTVVQSYPTGFSEDIYSRLDSGDLTVEDLRGAEGTVRYMSGGDAATEGSLQMALQHTLGTSNPDMENVSTMTIDYTGYTDYSLGELNGTRVDNYTDHVSETYEGLLFSSEVPASGFETGVEYSTDALGGTQSVLTSDGGRVSFQKGNFTITSIEDPDGNAVDSANYTDPQYDNYDADSWIDYVDQAEDTRTVIVEREGDGGSSGGWGLPSFGFGDGSGGLIGLTIIAAVALLVVGFVTDLIPGMGE